MRKIILAVAFVVAAAAFAAPSAQAQNYPSVKGLTPFTAGANYMSLPGFLRYTYAVQSGQFITYEEAYNQVQAQMAAG